ncbi:hypothetical protein AVEN_269455-1 [Araneus ventricosus]|uniref:Uncharacterized protein n=1 Tax=Araneus ventricosus TaxID=182803 RepID=A0A4Y2NWN4_ARAVE|nr:hypothetical protein AVEN_269455-1 [Araneus ventricosus]
MAAMKILILRMIFLEEGGYLNSLNRQPNRLLIQKNYLKRAWTAKPSVLSYFEQQFWDNKEDLDSLFLALENLNPLQSAENSRLTLPSSPTDIGEIRIEQSKGSILVPPVGLGSVVNVWNPTQSGESE